MTHSHSSGTPTAPGDTLKNEPGSVSEMSGSPELPLERSRFSRWLASFGLGESTHPLLRPLKSSRHHGGR